MATLKFFNNWFKTRDRVLGQYEKKVVVRGMLTLACFLWMFGETTQKQFILVHFTGYGNFKRFSSLVGA